MEKFLSAAQIIVPIFTAMLLGILARRKQLLTPEGNQGLQQFVMQFGMPCVLFGSTLTASMGAEALTSMAMVLPFLLTVVLVTFRLRKGAVPYHNLPMMFCAKETGMLGIPLYMTLFGASQAYRMGVLDVAQSWVVIPVISILASGTGKEVSARAVVGKVFRSPLLIMSLLGLVLNLTGAAMVLDRMGLLPILTETTGFIAQSVSSVILFSVGYSFSISSGNRNRIFRLSAVHFGIHALLGLAIQGILCLLPRTDPATRWAVLMYSTLPASYIAPTLARTEEEAAAASGVSSLLTVVSLIIFCVIAVIVA